MGREVWGFVFTTWLFVPEVRVSTGKGQHPKRRYAFPTILKDVRERMHLGQRDFADYLEVTQQTISLWERGLRKPGKRTWILLEQKLAYSRAQLEFGPLPALPESGVREAKSFTHPISLPPPQEGFPAMQVGVNGLASEAMDLAKAQRLLREAVRAGRPIWIVVG